jgi:glutathione S-transferase
MIDLYYWTTPNGHKITLFLEESGLPCTIHPVDLNRGAQLKPEFLAISPNNRIPAIVDTAPADGGGSVSVFESGAILLYLAEKSGKFLPQDLRGRIEVLQWLFWQAGGLGPMAGQNHHFKQYARGQHDYAVQRYQNETNRLYAVLNKRLADRALQRAAIRSPIWRSTPGSYLTKSKGRGLRIFRISSAGSKKLKPGRQLSAPTPKPMKSTKLRSRPMKRRGISCSLRLGPMSAKCFAPRRLKEAAGVCFIS